MISNNLKRKIEKNFNPLFIAGIITGLFIPGLSEISNKVPAYFLAAVIFLSVSKIDKQDLAYINIKEIIVFYFLRFLIFPVCIYFSVKDILSQFSNGILLLTIVPAGVSTAPLANLLGGSVSLGLSLTVFSSVFAPLAIPLVFYYLTSSEIKIDTVSMFYTLLFLIFIPVLLNLFVSKCFKKQSLIIKENASWLSVILISIMPIFILGKYQSEFFDNIFLSIEALIYLSILYFIYYFFPWFLNKNKEIKKKISYTLSSGANNSALAVVLGALYLDPINIIFLVLSEIIWTLALVPFKRFIDTKKKLS